MKSKKKTKKGKKSGKTNKSKKKKKGKTTVLGQKIKEALEDVLEQERATNPHAGSKFEDFMKLEQERFGPTTEKCGCTPEKGCLDADAAERQWKTEVVESHESKNSWVDSFFAIFGFKRK